MSEELFIPRGVWLALLIGSDPRHPTTEQRPQGPVLEPLLSQPTAACSLVRGSIHLGFGALSSRWAPTFPASSSSSKSPAFSHLARRRQLQLCNLSPAMPQASRAQDPPVLPGPRVSAEPSSAPCFPPAHRVPSTPSLSGSRTRLQALGSEGVHGLASTGCAFALGELF